MPVLSKIDKIQPAHTRLLLWDFDGTLGYRDGGMWTASLFEVLQREEPGLEVDIEQLRPYMQRGLPWNEPDRPHLHLANADAWWASIEPLFAEAYRGVGIPAQRAEELAGHFRGVYTNLERWRLFADTLPTLRPLAEQGWRQAILSNHVPELRGILTHLGLDGQFEQIFNSAETGYEKPHRRAFEIALRAFGSLEQVWMIGDNFQADVLGAQALGVPGILVRKAHPQAERFAEDLSKVMNLLPKP